MPIRIIPGRFAVLALAVCAAAVLLALLLGMPVRLAGRVAAGVVLLLAAAAAWDAFASRRAWRRAAPRMTRRMPPAFAIGIKQTVHLVIETEGAGAAPAEEGSACRGGGR